MAMQDTLAGRDASAQGVHIVGGGHQQHPPHHAAITMSSELAKLGCNTNSPMNVIPAHLQSPRNIASSHAHITNLQVTPTESATSPVHSMLLQSPKEEHYQQEQERRIRREIANSNERRRMQSINAGFKNLKSILPHTEGEKLSKAAILQQTSEYIAQLESDKFRLVQQNDKLKRALTECNCNSKCRSLADIFEKDEGIGSPAEEDYDDMKRGIAEVKRQLDKEMRMRMMLEQQLRNTESRLYNDSLQVGTPPSDKETSPSSGKDAAKDEFRGQSQPCARTLLPPLAPLGVQKSECRSEPQTQPALPNAAAFAPQTPLFVANGTDPGQIAGRHSICGEDTADGAKVAISSPQSEHSITVFSHSTKSNQPLKKRAIEILEVHQNVSDSGCEVTMDQPRSKVPKMSPDHPPARQRGNVPRKVAPGSSAAAPAVNATSLPAAVPALNSPRPKISLPALALSLPEPKVHFSPLSSQGLPKSAYKNILPHCSLPGSTVMSTKNSVSADHHAGKNNLGTFPPASENCVVPQQAAPIEFVTFVNRSPGQEAMSQGGAVPGPVYFTVSGAPNGIAYVQQDGDKLVPLSQQFQQSQYIVAPLGNACGAAVLNQNMHPQSNAPLSAQTHPTYPQSSVVSSVPMSQGLTFVRNNTTPCTLASDSPKPAPDPHTLLGYSQPEITLNQLNALPNLALPKSLHQSVLTAPVGATLVTASRSDSPYVMPNMQDNVLAKMNTYINPAALRCRNSSLSTGDSSSAASGAEDEDTSPRVSSEPSDSQCSAPAKVVRYWSDNAESVPRKSGNGGCDEGANDVATKAVTSSDGAGSNSTAKATPALANAPASSPVIRRVNSIQSRGNLETIVQAIDHLEQQERRNSQDQPEKVH